jgi:D-xylose 1-dehydrogenase (NADP+, D-xylono-1,5-lactone-forming)
VTVSWGILSTARINDLVLAGARKSDSVRMLAVASRDAGRAETYAREHGFERAYGSYDGLLGDPDVEAVYISLPNGLHVEWSIRALEAGKHVLCEKPLTAAPAEAERAFDVAERQGLILMEAFMWRHHPQTLRLKEIVDDGAIGELRLIRAAFSFPAGDPADARLLNEPDGGSLMDVGCYCVNATRLLAGEPHQVYGAHVLNDAGVDVRFAATMLSAGGVVTQFDSSVDVPVREELELVGERGHIVVHDPWHGLEPELELRRDGETDRFPIEAADSYQLELENLGDAIRGTAQPLLGRADAVGQARVLEALFRSAREQRPIAGSGLLA